MLVQNTAVLRRLEPTVLDDLTHEVVQPTCVATQQHPYGPPPASPSESPVADPAAASPARARCEQRDLPAEDRRGYAEAMPTRRRPPTPEASASSP